ncbi:ABC transporter ATP-binding protein [Stigmatella hybrida]|uniref:ABC transporter ATP-binding protein n=1 Tax=Stigmatella hybrida TaxID=394097 RepID=UPI001CDA5CDE|nr:ABC transporter ATP-binding protein [Stigmatella hybrida]
MRTAAEWRASLAHVPQTLRLVWGSAPGETAALAGLTLAVAVLPVTVAWLGKQIVDAVVTGSREATLRWVLAELGAVAALVLAQRLLGLVRSGLGSRVSLDVNVSILQKARSLELHQFEDPHVQDQLTRARREASSRPVSVVSRTFGILESLVSLLGFAALLISLSPWAVCALLLSSMPATLAEMRFSARIFQMKSGRAQDNRRLFYFEYLLTAAEHAKEIRIFRLGDTLLSRYRTLGERFYEEDRQVARRRALWGFLLSLVGTGAFYGSYGVTALAAADGRISLGEMTLYLAAFRMGQQAFQALLGAVGGMYEDSLYMSNLFGFLAIPSSQTQARLLTASAAPGAEQGIRFESVGFRYPDSEAWALKELNLFIPASQSLALVGHNGAGKSTFIKLLTRLYRPTQGRILLDGRDLNEWEEETLRQRIGVIFQDYNEFQFAVRENVGFGSIDHVEDTARVQRAIEKGGAAEFVTQLSKGLNTQLGRWFKDGTDLSGGQWQKLAISRAFMREEADIFILDEPTASLDAESEKAVFERFRHLAAGRTAILISHRFPTVRLADKIVVLEGGQIIEQGGHEELLSSGGRYAKLFTLQAEGYR